MEEKNTELEFDVITPESEEELSNGFEKGEKLNELQ